MTVINAYTRQPSKLDYAEPTKFRFSLLKLPKVEYFCTAANIPGITMGTFNQATPLKDIPIPGDKVEYGTLNISFLVDENLENYREIHGWMTGLGFPKDHSQFRAIQNSGSDRYPTTKDEGIFNDIGQVKSPTGDDGGLYSDATLFILTSKNNPNIEVRFRDVYPLSLSGLDYNQQETDINYLTANVTFEYKIYEFATANGIVDSFTGDGITTSFTLSTAAERADILVGGVLMKRGVDYHIVSGNVVRFTKAPAGSTAITVTITSNTTIEVVS